MRSALQAPEAPSAPRRVHPGDEMPTERAEVVRLVRDRVRRGIYRPADDVVAETLLAWFWPSIRGVSAAGN